MRNCLLVLFLAITSFTAYAQEKAQLNCDSPQTQLEMNRCAAESFKKADAELNIVYKEIMMNLDRTSKSLLVSAQKSWLVVRDNHCGLYEQFYKGGSIMPLMVYTCKTELTENRIRELKMILMELKEN